MRNVDMSLKREADMKIVVVGGNGFIGKEFTGYATERGHQTVVIGSSVDAFSDSGGRQISEVLSGSAAVVFLAAKRPTADFSLEDYYYNIRLAGTYFEYIRKSGIKNVVITSSTAAYSSLNIPWKEQEWESPLSLYGASKQAVDSLVSHYNNKYDMKIKSLRLAQVIGMGERKGFLLNTLIDNAIMGKKQTIYGTGAGRRQYIYIKDVCDALLHSVTVRADYAGVFNIGLNYNVSIIELAQLINEVFENKAGIEILSDKPEDTKQYLMDVTKAEQELHWKPKYDLRQAFTEIKEKC